MNPLLKHRSRLALLLASLASLSACSASNDETPSAEHDENREHLGHSHQKLIADDGVYGEALPPYTIAFTYDDGPDAHSEELGQLLASEGIHATFFVNGCRLQGSPFPDPDTGSCLDSGQRYPLYSESVLASLRSMGHHIANHTQDHIGLQGLEADPQRILTQVRLTQSVVDRYVSDGYFFLRPPYGSWSPAVASAIRSDSQLNKLVGPVIWDVLGDRGDWDCMDEHVRAGNSVENATAICGQYYLDALERRPNHNGIFLFHDRQEFAVGTDYAVRLARWMIDHIDRNLYTYVPLDAVPNLKGQLQSKPASNWSSRFSDNDGFGASRSGYGSLRFADLNGDRKADVCGRRSDGVYCAIANSGSFREWTRWSTALSDAAGFAPVQYGSTLQLGDINADGRADLCARGPSGLTCALSSGSAFGSPRLWSSNNDFSDADGWGAAAGYYGSLDLGDVNGDGRADVCGRGPAGIVCALSNGTRFAAKTGWKTDDFSDAHGWLPEWHGATVQLADVNGDRRADVCGRSYGGIGCALSNGSSFGEMRWTGNHFSNRDHWADASARYLAIRFADVNGDGKADTCGRNTTGVVCQFARGDGTFADYRYLNNAELRDDQGFVAEKYGMTLALADLTGDGRADLCARTATGLRCAVSP
ncbi:MAG: FG-GAP-like repeat-containing protein [Myxococcota bacterium]